jgi:hypothetical protein
VEDSKLGNIYAGHCWRRSEEVFGAWICQALEEMKEQGAGLATETGTYSSELSEPSAVCLALAGDLNLAMNDY